MAGRDMRLLKNGSHRKLMQPASVLLLLVGVTVYVHLGGKRNIKPPAQAPALAKAEPPPQQVVVASPIAPVVRPKSEPSVAPAPAPPAVPRLDRAAIAKAEAALDSASRDRARAEARAAAAAGNLEAAANQAALDAALARKLAFRIRDPSAQISRVAARGGFLRAERDKLKEEVSAPAHLAPPQGHLDPEQEPRVAPHRG